MRGQIELFEKKIKKPRLPDARGYDITGGYAEKEIARTKKEHICRICGNKIPAGSPAREIIQVVSGKLLVQSKEYAHKKDKCFLIAD